MASNTKKIAIGISIGISLGLGGSFYVSIEVDKVNKYVCEDIHIKSQMIIDSTTSRVDSLKGKMDSLNVRIISLETKEDSIIAENADSLLSASLSDSLAMLDSINRSFPQFTIDNVHIIPVLSGKKLILKNMGEVYFPGEKVDKLHVDFLVTGWSLPTETSNKTTIYIGLMHKGRIYYDPQNIVLSDGTSLDYSVELSIRNNAENVMKQIKFDKPMPESYDSSKDFKGFPNGTYTLFFRTDKRELAKYTIEFKAQNY